FVIFSLPSLSTEVTLIGNSIVFASPHITSILVCTPSTTVIVGLSVTGVIVSVCLSVSVFTVS
ncbi:hypothetical protein ACN09X_11585, partial [Aliarcobacter butzleri]|uniref:hypothetical protein n=1 Tax=Aliarcobacter butzleri TaxID=28197 RepID=UPI003AE289D3